MWRVIKTLSQSVESSVIVNDEQIDWFEVETGVRQGCILSPILFNIFIDGLANLIKKPGGVKIHEIDVRRYSLDGGRGGTAAENVRPCVSI